MFKSNDRKADKQLAKAGRTGNASNLARAVELRNKADRQAAAKAARRRGR